MPFATALDTLPAGEIIDWTAFYSSASFDKYGIIMSADWGTNLELDANLIYGWLARLVNVFRRWLYKKHLGIRATHSQ